jgi:predicted ATP-dependent endonuclease of OLD family
MKHKDDIIAKVEKLGKIAAKAADASHRKSLTIYDLREHLDKKEEECNDLWHKAMERSGRINELTRQVSALQAKADVQGEFIGLFKRCEPQKFSEVKQLQEHIQAQREEEQLQQSTTRKKKSWGLE